MHIGIQYSDILVTTGVFPSCRDLGKSGFMTLTVNDLSIERAGRRIISELSFRVNAGEALILRGPNGVGKSTLLRGLAGLIACDGEISVSFEDMSYAGHLDALKPALSVRENLEIWAGLAGARNIDAAINAFALDQILEQPVHVCSAGQKRRAGLARLAFEGRKLWLMDEPTVALDKAAIALLEAAIVQHLETGGMALIATHVSLGFERTTLELAPVDAAQTDPFLEGGFL